MKRVWENPEIQSINRLPMRSSLVPYESAQKSQIDAAAGPESCEVPQSAFFKSLDGEWDFCFFESPEYSPDEKTLWKKIKVPLSWTMQGFSSPHYTNIQMPFDYVPPFVPEKNPTGYYRLNVSLPEEWNGRRIVLHIGSAESVAIVYINGEEAGVSKDTRLPCEFDITDFIKGSAAEIIIKVVRWSDASYVEDQDQWWFGGIHRSVYLYSTEKVFIQDAKALTYIDFSSEIPKGIIPLEISLAASDLKCKAQTQADQMLFDVEYKVCRLEGTPSKGIPGNEIASGLIPCSLDLRNTLSLAKKDIEIENPALWSSETPSLYLVTVSLLEKDKRHIESSSFIVGFKSVEIKNRELLFNSKKVYIHGVNRHEHSEFNAKTLSTAEMVRDIKTLKKYNFNSVRTCHYPDDERWYELCDRYGIYILDEANIENHAYYDVMSRSEEWLNSYIQRVQRMAIRDKNHVCIFGWSLGNESGNGQNHHATAAWLRGYDSTRIVHYEGFVRPKIHQGDFTLESLSYGKELTDLIAPMYPSIDLIVEYATKCDDWRPLIMCEYSHAMGNANGSLADYWKAIESTHGLQGGFIWDWIDQGIAAHIPEDKLGDEDGGKYWKYGGDFGDSPCDYDFCLNGLNFPDQTPKPAMEECRRLFAPVRLAAIHAAQGIFEVKSRACFVPLDFLSLKWSCLVDGTVKASGEFPLDKVLPENSIRIEIPQVTECVQNADSHAEIMFHADFIYSRQTPWAEKGELCSADEELISAGQTCFIDSADSVSPEAEQLALTLVPTVFHAYTENEGIKALYDKVDDKDIPGCFIGKPTKLWMDCALEYSHCKKDQHGVFHIVSEKNGKMFDFGTCSCDVKKAWHEKSSFMEICAGFKLNNTVPEYPRVGLESSVSSIFSKIKWYGCGPHECYSDRKYTALKGLHEMAIKDLGVPYIVPQENGLRCGVKYLELSGEGKTLHIQSDSEFSFSLLPYTAHDLYKCRHTSELVDLSKGNEGKWILIIDAAHRGVGTGACGPDTLEQYRLRPGAYKLNLRIW
ncbi:glycoside hydrolase family 2 TIM barrel-domain containing protein [Treponema sp.]|uniref:glycoside hydrolase family 2 TIM barrel-domain containing protein n=1 Tax=Treponema sp. TaxID=166 RepID=UPI003EFE2CE7